jgi:hypothetical protein
MKQSNYSKIEERIQKIAVQTERITKSRKRILLKIDKALSIAVRKIESLEQASIMRQSKVLGGAK